MQALTVERMKERREKTGAAGKDCRRGTTEGRRGEKEPKTAETIRRAAASEIDELFDRPKTAETICGAAAAAAKTRRPPPERDGMQDVRGMGSKVRPLTDDGLPVYSAQEMKIGMGGDTDQCPFDCACCF